MAGGLMGLNDTHSALMSSPIARRDADAGAPDEVAMVSGDAPEAQGVDHAKHLGERSYACPANGGAADINPLDADARWRRVLGWSLETLVVR
jgi:hypothetical protein